MLEICAETDKDTLSRRIQPWNGSAFYMRIMFLHVFQVAHTERSLGDNLVGT